MLNRLRGLEKKLLKGMNFKRKRYLYEKIDFSSQMIGIVGSRGVGKTTLLLHHLKEIKKKKQDYKSLYFSFDFLANTDVKLFDLAQEFVKIGGEWLMIDEIHKYKNFALDLKVIYDFYPHLKVIFTGSCASSIYSSQADLSRRVVLYKMQGMSYREFLEFKLDANLSPYSLEDILNKSIEIVDVLEDKFLPLEAFNEYLMYGYYPFYFKDKNNYLSLLNAVINQIIDIDLVSLELIKPHYANKLKKLLLVISESNPFELNITKIASSIEVSRTTLYSYLHHLANSELLNIISSDKGVSKLNKPEKLYLNNTNLFYTLVSEPKIGTIREAFFVSQLKHHDIKYSSKGDFKIDNKYVFEIGGNTKGFKQIKDIKNSYLVVDTDSTQNLKKIPLWLFGFLY